MKTLPREFYNRPTLQVARELIGKLVVHQSEAGLMSGKIVETEAYIGQDDPACHAANGRTPRTEIMFGPPGFAYIYFIYGMYHCLNAVTEGHGFPAAVLIRALEPLEGISLMQQNRGQNKLNNLTNGPGKLCQALSLDKRQNGLDLCADDLRIIDQQGTDVGTIRATRRIGIRVGVEKPWRFCLADNPFISHPKHR